MVCKNCGSEIQSSDTFCRVCGKTAGKDEKKFKLSIPEEKLGDIIKKETLTEKEPEKKTEAEKETVEVEKEETTETAKEQVKAKTEETSETETGEEKTSEAVDTEIEGLKEEKDAEKVESVSENESLQNATAEKEAKKEVPKTKKAGTKTEEKLKVSAEKAAERKTELLKEKQRKKVKNADILMKVIVSLCAVVTVALAFVSGYTGVFRDDGKEKTVALSILPSSDSSLFEETVVKYACLFDEGYNCEEKASDDMLLYMKPESKGGLYAALNKVAKAESITPDPAGRFEVNEDGTGESYTKVSSKSVGKVLSSISLENLKDVNTENCYYYDGYYYFRASEEEKAEDLTAKVTSAKKTSEGNYYIVCDITSYSSQMSEAVSKKYFLATLNETDGEKSWSIRKISSEPLYDDFGNPVEDENIENNNSLSFVMKRQTVTAKTKSGTVFAKYVVEYPYFETQGAAESAINAIYTQKIENFEALSEKATSDYKKYIKNGGSKKDLPLYTTVEASVKLNDDSYFSLVEKTTEYNPLTESETAETTSVTGTSSVTETEETVITFPKTTFESYTFRIDDGEFIKKDEVTGKDYLAVQELLYRIWLGADETVDESAIPSDVNGIGAKIYASPWTLTKEGMLFSYCNDEGYLEEITVPYEKLTERTVMK